MKDKPAKSLRDEIDVESRQKPGSSWPRAHLVLWLAQGFGLGRIPVAPGTFGSLPGLVWFAVLLLPGSLWLYALGVAVGLGLSVWACGAAERILGQKDPPSVVLDEITAMPVCFLPWLIHYLAQHGAMPAIGEFFGPQTWPFTAGIFLLFRAFDVVKPWPVRRSQKLAGGLGITLDDFLAAAYVAFVTVAFLLAR